MISISQKIVVILVGFICKHGAADGSPDSEFAMEPRPFGGMPSMDPASLIVQHLHTISIELRPQCSPTGALQYQVGPRLSPSDTEHSRIFLPMCLQHGALSFPAILLPFQI